MVKVLRSKTAIEYTNEIIPMETGRIIIYCTQNSDPNAEVARVIHSLPRRYPGLRLHESHTDRCLQATQGDHELFTFYENKRKIFEATDVHSLITKLANHCSFVPAVPEDVSGGKEKPQKKTHSKSYGYLFYVVAVVVVPLFLGIVFYGKIYLTSTDNEERNNIPSLYESIRDVEDKYPALKGSDLWIEFLSGIENVRQHDPSVPSVFLLLHDGPSDSVACLLNQIGSLATQFLNGSVLSPLLIEGEKLENGGHYKEYGEFLEEYLSQVEEHRSVIVMNLHKIPGHLAMSFHYFCDSVNPMVDKAVYFFTLRVPGGVSETENPTKVAENSLKRLWASDIKSDILKPLIVRITGGTVSFLARDLNLLSDCTV